MAEAVRAYVGLGSNLEDPVEQLRRAMDAIAILPDTTVAARSPLYRSRPMGPQDQPDFVNAVVAIDTRLEPRPLLHGLHAIERDHGRLRDGRRWGPRTLDLDLLLYGQLRQDDAELTLPHPGIAERDFVLVPLHAIAAELRIPGLPPLPILLAACADHGLTEIAP